MRVPGEEPAELKSATKPKTHDKFADAHYAAENLSGKVCGGRVAELK